jgi:hypothetical protein
MGPNIYMQKHKICYSYFILFKNKSVEANDYAKIMTEIFNKTGWPLKPSAYNMTIPSRPALYTRIHGIKYEADSQK